MNPDEIIAGLQLNLAAVTNFALDQQRVLDEIADIVREDDNATTRRVGAALRPATQLRRHLKAS